MRSWLAARALTQPTWERWQRCTRAPRVVVSPECKHAAEQRVNRCVRAFRSDGRHQGEPDALVDRAIPRDYVLRSVDRHVATAQCRACRALGQHLSSQRHEPQVRARRAASARNSGG